MDTLGDILVKALSELDNSTLKQSLELQTSLLTYENQELSAYIKDFPASKKIKKSLKKADLTYLLASTLIYRLTTKLNKDLL